LPLIVRFALLSMLAVAVLGIGLFQVFSHSLRGQALDAAEERGVALTYALKDRLSPAVFRTTTSGDVAALQGMLTETKRLQVPQERLAANRSTAGPGGASGEHRLVDALRLWSGGPHVVWQSADGPAGAPTNPLVRQAFSGTVTSQLLEVSRAGTGASEVLDVYVPMSFTGARVDGVVELQLPYDTTRALVGRAEQHLGWALLGGLLLLWLLLFRIVQSASRRLRSQAAENRRLASLDPLTGLPNRRLLGERLGEAVTSTARGAGKVALLLDVDRFKEVNDTLGHAGGDELLREIAARLSSAARGTDTVARLGGDEFAVVAPDVNNVGQAERLARRLLDGISQPFVVAGLDLHVEVSVGVAVLPDHAGDVETLLRCADVAMYAAKAARVGVLVYCPDDDSHDATALLMLAELRRALDERQLTVHYQPQVCLRTGRLVRMEALLRWPHPRGAVSPAEFIPLAERTGLIQPLTHYVLEEVTAQLSAWQQEGIAVPVAINLSARNLLDPTLVDQVLSIVRRYDLDPRLIELELTESAIVEQPERAAAVLGQLADMGICLSLDDFGTGYTSMSQLESLPLDTLKIDRSFVSRMLSDESGGVLVKAIIELAHEFGLSVVAEGVETAAAAERLRELGCDLA
jgi:diguanylate cyclase (GGDEF)-like protein